MGIYAITDWLGLVPIFICIAFAGIGLMQALKRRSIFKVDRDIVLLGVYYVIVFLAYVIFEMIPINYRPILIDGIMEASYPSSTTLLVLSVMPTLSMQVNRRATSPTARRIVTLSSIAVFSVCGNWATCIWRTLVHGYSRLAIAQRRTVYDLQSMRDLTKRQAGISRRPSFGIQRKAQRTKKG